MVTAGVKLFICTKLLSGKSEKIKFGTFPYFGIDDARNKLIELKTQIAKGINPVMQKKLQKIAVKGTLSLKQFFFDRYIAEYAKHNVITYKSLVLQMNRQAESIYDKPLTSITSDDIRGIFNDLTARISKTTANRFLILIRTVFNKAIKWKMLLVNPVLSVDKHRANEPRSRYITEEEMPRLQLLQKKKMLL